MKATSPFEPTPWTYYKPKPMGPASYAELFYTLIGLLLCSASAGFVIWLSFKLWAAVVS